MNCSSRRSAWTGPTASGERLRDRIRRIKDRYLRQVEVTYDELTALGYAIYHLPDYYATTQYVLADLANGG